MSDSHVTPQVTNLPNSNKSPIAQAHSRLEKEHAGSTKCLEDGFDLVTRKSDLLTVAAFQSAGRVS